MNMNSLILPKSPLVIFVELYKNVSILVNEEVNNNCNIFTAKIMVEKNKNIII